MTAPAYPGFSSFPSMGQANSRALFEGGPKNQPGTFDCDADRIIPAGGALASHLLHPDVKPFSRVRRILSSSGLYMATKKRPYQAVVFAYTVPHETTLALCGATTRPYTFDPLAAGDAIPLENRRLSLSLGYDLTFSTAGRLGNVQAGVIPIEADIQANVAYPNIPTQSVGFAPLPSQSNNGEASVFLQTVNTAYGVSLFEQQQTDGTPGNATPENPRQFVLTAGGSGVQPQDQDHKQGPEDMPFTYLVKEGESVTMSVVAFAPVRIPLAFIEAVLVGYLLPKTSLEALLQRMRPCG